MLVYKKYITITGTGKKGGMMSVFLMGCLDKRRNRWVTVTKVHTGHDDTTLERLQKELSPLMLKISQDYNKLPNWLDCNKGMVPDFIAMDPKKQPVWEITGMYILLLLVFYFIYVFNDKMINKAEGTRPHPLKM